MSIARVRGVPVRSLAVAALLAAPVVATAQEAPPDTLPFRRGQWAAQFGGGSDLLSIGVLRFRSPRSALLLDGRVTFQNGDFDVRSTTSTQASNVDEFDRSLFALVGLRTYRPVASRAVGFGTVGVLGGWSKQGFEIEPLGGPRQRQQVMAWFGGLLAEVGASYMVSPRFSLGAIWSFQATYQRLDQVDDFEGFAVEGGILSLAANPFSLMATVYF